MFPRFYVHDDVFDKSNSQPRNIVLYVSKGLHNFDMIV